MPRLVVRTDSLDHLAGKWCGDAGAAGVCRLGPCAEPDERQRALGICRACVQLVRAAGPAAHADAARVRAHGAGSKPGVNAVRPVNHSFTSLPAFKIDAQNRDLTCVF